VTLQRDENGLGFTIAGGHGSTPYRGNDQVPPPLCAFSDVLSVESENYAELLINAGINTAFKPKNTVTLEFDVMLGLMLIPLMLNLSRSIKTKISASS